MPDNMLGGIHKPCGYQEGGTENFLKLLCYSQGFALLNFYCNKNATLQKKKVLGQLKNREKCFKIFHKRSKF